MISGDSRNVLPSPKRSFALNNGSPASMRLMVLRFVILERKDTDETQIYTDRPVVEKVSNGLRTWKAASPVPAEPVEHPD